MTPPLKIIRSPAAGVLAQFPVHPTIPRGYLPWRAGRRSGISINSSFIIDVIRCGRSERWDE